MIWKPLRDKQLRYAVFFKENVKYPVWTHTDPISLPFKNWRYIIINALIVTESGAFSKPSLVQVLFIYFLVWIFSEDNVIAKTKLTIEE